MDCCSAMNSISDCEVRGGSADAGFEFRAKVKHGAVAFENCAMTMAEHGAGSIHAGPVV